VSAYIVGDDQPLLSPICLFRAHVPFLAVHSLLPCRPRFSDGGADGGLLYGGVALPARITRAWHLALTGTLLGTVSLETLCHLALNPKLEPACKCALHAAAASATRAPFAAQMGAAND
jgi:hypothetical protein